MEIFNFIGATFTSVAYIISICLLNKIELRRNKTDIIVAIAILTIVTYLNGLIMPNNLKPIISLVFLVLLQLSLLKNKIDKTFVSTIFVNIFAIIFELMLISIVALIALLLGSYTFNDLIDMIGATTIGGIISNILFAIALFVFGKNKFVSLLYNKVLNFKILKNPWPILYVVIFSFFVIIFGYELLFYEKAKILLILIFLSLILLLVYMVHKNVKITNISNETKEKYNSTLKNLVEYEDMIDKYRVSNHENKNQLQMIRTMIHQKDKTVEKYIDNLLDNVYMVNEKLMMDVSMLPSGIKATIYTKMVMMENKRISYKLNVDRKLRYVDFFDRDDNIETSLNICDILSVFLDNAIEEIENKKDPEIYIEVFYDEKDEELTFEISNKIYNKEIDLNKLPEKGYTTKSNGHGYGLALVSEIVSANSRLENKTIIKNNIFTQRLTLKLK